MSGWIFFLHLDSGGSIIAVQAGDRSDTRVISWFGKNNPAAGVWCREKLRRTYELFLARSDAEWNLYMTIFVSY